MDAYKTEEFSFFSNSVQREVDPTITDGIRVRNEEHKVLRDEDAKDSALLSSRDGYFLDPTEWPKGSQSSCEVWRDEMFLWYL